MPLYGGPQVLEAPNIYMPFTYSQNYSQLLAQLVERLVSDQKAVSSNPTAA